MHGNSYIGRGAVKARREGEEHVEHHNKAISDHTTGTLCTHTHNNNRPREREKGAACLYLWGICSHKTHTHNTAKHTLETLTHTHTHTRICMDTHTHTQKYWYTLTFCMLYAINKLWYTFNFTHRYFHYKYTSTCTQNATFAYTNTHSFSHTKINMNNYLALPYWMLHVTSESHF